MMHTANRRWFLRRSAMAAVAAAFAALLVAPAQAQEPIKIGFSMALTGPLAGAGQGALLAMKVWEDDINKKGGLLGRKVQLIYFDDKSNPSEVPGIYTKLLDIDKVDIIMGPYASTQIAPTLPIAIQRNKLLISLFGTGINDNFKYNRYFSMIPTGPNPKPAFTKGFFDIAMAQNPKPQTIAIAASDAEFARNAQDGARENAKAAGLKIVYDRTYPPTTTDLGPIVRAVQAANPDIVVVCSYPLELGWLGSRGERDRICAKDDRRRHGWTAIHGDQAAAGPTAERLGELRDLDPGKDDAISGRPRCSWEVSGASESGEGGPAGLLPAALGVRLSAGA